MFPATSRIPIHYDMIAPFIQPVLHPNVIVRRMVIKIAYKGFSFLNISQSIWALSGHSLMLAFMTTDASILSNDPKPPFSSSARAPYNAPRAKKARCIAHRSFPNKITR